MRDLQALLAKIDRLKEEVGKLRPLPQEALEKIQAAWDVAYTYESNRIEGNTLTMQETELVVQEGLTIGGKSMREHLEAINHYEAIGFIKEVAKEDVPVTLRLILQIHALILRGIDRDNAGRWRTVPALISGSRHVPPQPFLLEKLLEDFLHEFQAKEKSGEHPVLIAAYLHDELVRIHPFIDGNGRTSRLLMNLYLLRHGYLIVNLRGDGASRLQYYKALEESHLDKNPQAFQKLVVTAELASLKAYLELLGVPRK